MHPSRQAYVEEAVAEVSFIPYTQHPSPTFIKNVHMNQGSGGVWFPFVI